MWPFKADPTATMIRCKLLPDGHSLLHPAKQSINCRPNYRLKLMTFNHNSDDWRHQMQYWTSANAAMNVAKCNTNKRDPIEFDPFTFYTLVINKALIKCTSLAETMQLHRYLHGKMACRMLISNSRFRQKKKRLLWAVPNGHGRCTQVGSGEGYVHDELQVNSSHCSMQTRTENCHCATAARPLNVDNAYAKHCTVRKW